VEWVGNRAVDDGVGALGPVAVAVAIQAVAVETEAFYARRQHVEHLEALLELGKAGVVAQDLGSDE
jgi:hypothetical protein